MVRPGVTMAQVAEACAVEAERLDLRLKFAAGRSRHSVGLMLIELPSITVSHSSMIPFLSRSPACKISRPFGPAY